MAQEQLRPTQGHTYSAYNNLLSQASGYNVYKELSLPIPPEEQQWLDQPLNGSLSELFGRECVPKPLRNMVMPIRDVLVLGREYAASPDGMRYIGAVSIQAIDALIAQNNYGHTWEPAPRMSDIVRIARNLSDVTAKALKLDIRLDQYASDISVRDVLRMPIAERRERWRVSTRTYYLYPNIHIPYDIDDRLCYYPELFGLRFQIEQVRRRRQLREK